MTARMIVLFSFFFLALNTSAQKSKPMYYIVPDSSNFNDGSKKCIITTQGDTIMVSSAPVNSGKRWLSSTVSIDEFSNVDFTVFAFNNKGKHPRKCNGMFLVWGVTSKGDTVLLKEQSYTCGQWANYVTVDWYKFHLCGKDFMKIYLTMYTMGISCLGDGQICVGGDGGNTASYQLGKESGGKHGVAFGSPQTFDGWWISKKPWNKQRLKRAKRILKSRGS